MDNIELEKIKDLLSNPQNFVCYLDMDNWIIFKKKEDVKGLTNEKILEVDCYYLSHSANFIINILRELKFKILDMNL